MLVRQGKLSVKRRHATAQARIPICRTPEARLFMQKAILDQIVASPSFHPNNKFSSSTSIIAKCIERVTHEGNSHLLYEQELPAIMDGQKRRIKVMLSGRSHVRKAMYKSHQVYCVGKLIYSQSPIRRASYHIGQFRRYLATTNECLGPGAEHLCLGRSARGGDVLVPYSRPTHIAH
jgi:hypothetical protein